MLHIFKYPPLSYVTPGPNGSFIYAGFNIEFVNWLAEALDLK